MRPPVGNVQRTRWNSRGAGPACTPACVGPPRNIAVVDVDGAAANHGRDESERQQSVHLFSPCARLSTSGSSIGPCSYVPSSSPLAQAALEVDAELVRLDAHEIAVALNKVDRQVVDLLADDDPFNRRRIGAVIRERHGHVARVAHQFVLANPLAFHLFRDRSAARRHVDLRRAGTAQCERRMVAGLGERAGHHIGLLDAPVKRCRRLLRPGERTLDREGQRAVVWRDVDQRDVLDREFRHYDRADPGAGPVLVEVDRRAQRQAGNLHDALPAAGDGWRRIRVGGGQRN